MDRTVNGGRDGRAGRLEALGGLPDLPAQLRRRDGDGVGDLRGIIEHARPLAELGVDVVWLSPVYRSPMDDNGYDISDYQRRRPAVRHPRRLRRADRRPCTRAASADDGPRRQPHHRRAPVVRGVAVGPGQPKRDWYWWRDARPGQAPAPRCGADQLGVALLRVGLGVDEESGQYYLHLFSRKQPDLNWENPDVRAAVYDDDALVARPGRRRLPHGRHQHDPQGPGAARPAPRPGSLSGRVTSTSPAARGSTSSSQEMHREVFADRAGARADRRRDARRDARADAVLFTDPARARGGHGVPVRARAARLRRAPQMGPAAAGLPASSGRWRPGRPGSPGAAGTSLYFGNHDQPRAVSRFGDDGAHRVASAKTLATVLHCHRGTPYVYQGDELGMTNAPYRTIDEYRDIQALNFHADAVGARRRRPDRRARGDGPDEPRQRAAPRCSGTPRRRRDSRPGRPGSR